MTLTIVVVDDDPDTLDFLDLLLSDQGFTVITSDYTGDVAGLIMRVLPDVVLLDLQNGSDRLAGLTVLDLLRAELTTVDVRVILMTADHATLDQQAARIGELRVAVVKKPFASAQLLRLIEQGTA